MTINIAMSEIRELIFKQMDHYRDILQPDDKGWDVLEIGIDGDEKPSGNYKVFGKGNNWKTMDKLSRLNPDYVEDIETYLPISLLAEFDLVICSQTLEHTLNIDMALASLMALSRGYVIIDLPFMWEYHGQPDYDDYWRMSHTALIARLREFECIECSIVNNILTSGLFKSHD